ncbi:hypothetical protein TNCT_225181 [Trichonephila clavata]|uniref:Uncharacterized protein n=1 Tax=Trichonephila clavata TaxID=2740835 RepID=A0A8X6FCY9_TRICU|nr:hypothetical protein TNCT_225181 [Trichonephila clavata]
MLTILFPVVTNFKRIASNFTKSKRYYGSCWNESQRRVANDANLMEPWKKENFDVHPVHETESLGANETRVLGLSWNTHEHY